MKRASYKSEPDHHCCMKMANEIVGIHSEGQPGEMENCLFLMKMIQALH